MMNDNEERDTERGRERERWQQNGSQGLFLHKLKLILSPHFLNPFSASLTPPQVQ